MEMKYVMRNVYAHKEDTAKNFVNAINYYANIHIMDVIVSKVIVAQIIVHAI